VHDPSGHAVQRRKIHFDQLINEWPLDFDYNFLELTCFGHVGWQPGAVHLSQGGSRQWLRLEALEQLLERRTQLGFRLSANRCEVLRGHFILQA
jgi:hypothetical protein